MIYFLLSLIPIIVLTYLKSRKSIHMMQQNYYDESNRYLLWIFKNLKKVFIGPEICFALICLFINIDYKITCLVFALLSLAILFRYITIKEQVKKPLVVTPRVKRMFITEFIIYVLIIVAWLVNFNKINVAMIYLHLSLLTYLSTFFVYGVEIDCPSAVAFIVKL